jgi:hypothetical protein
MNKHKEMNNTKKAQNGLDLLEKVNPYTRENFWVGLGIFIIAPVSFLIKIAIGV